MTITKNDVSRFTFGEYRKVAITKLSDEVFPAGTQVKGLEGEYTCSEPSRLATDVDGNPYLIAESIVRKAYERV